MAIKYNFEEMARVLKRSLLTRIFLPYELMIMTIVELVKSRQVVQIIYNDGSIREIRDPSEIKQITKELWEAMKKDKETHKILQELDLL